MNKMIRKKPLVFNFKKYLLLVTAFSFSIFTNAQQACTVENAHSLMGTWKNTNPDFTDHSPADAAKERPVLKDIFNTIRTNFKWPLQGGEITYVDQAMNNRSSALPLFLSRKLNTSTVEVIFHDFLCVNGNVQPNESSYGISVTFNDVPFKGRGTFFTKTIVDPTPEERDIDDLGTSEYFYSSILPDFKNGIWDFYLGSKVGNTIYTQDILELEQINYVYRIIARQGIAPVIAMTKKEYYSHWIKKLQFEVTENEKQIKKINNYKDPNLDANAKKQMSEMYEQLKINAAKNISAIENVRKNLTTEQLAKPAIFHEEEGQYIETPNFDNNEVYILRVNPDYFNTQIPKTSFQLCFIKVATLGVWHGTQPEDPRKVPYHKFISEIFRMNAIELITQKVKPLIKN